MAREWSALSRFVFFSMMVGFFISAEYTITRPASHSIFLSVFSAQQLPIAWFCTIPLNLILVALYNWLIPKVGPLKIALYIIGSVIVINTACAFLIPLFPKMIFIHFCWKDLYILFMFQQMWSMIHCTVPSDKAKIFYGIIFGSGTLAMTLGSILPSLWAVQIGSEKLFLATAPLYILLALFYIKAFRLKGIGLNSHAMHGGVRDSFSFVVKNRQLLAILCLVIFMQITVALVEYQFSHYLEIEIPEKDIRTAFFSKILFLVHALSLALQVLGAVYLFKKVSIRMNHILAPLLIAVPSVGQLVFPGFSMACSSLILTKSIDWSIFGVMREMLFTSLSTDEKFRAKAVIDIFAYRTAKALVSFFLLSGQLLIGGAIFPLAKTATCVTLVAWLLLVMFLFRKRADPGLVETKII